MLGHVLVLVPLNEHNLASPSAGFVIKFIEEALVNRIM